uniref:Uncharacterized protein n=1 Tax=Geospiza parvula TaxID=87175 RepID=A0A8U8BU19_GEOPR
MVPPARIITLRRPLTSPPSAASRRGDAIAPPMSRRRRFGDPGAALAAKRRRPELPGEPPRPDGTGSTGSTGGGGRGALGGVPGVPVRVWGSRCPFGVPSVDFGGPGAVLVWIFPGSHVPARAVEAALAAVAPLFPRRLFGDALPPLVLRHQLYSVTGDRTAVDRELNRLRDEGRVRLLHLGLGPDVLGVVSLELYREKAPGGFGVPVGVPVGPCGGPCGSLGVPGGPWGSLIPPFPLPRHLVAVGLLTVRDAGSWWLAGAGAGSRPALLRGRRALLALVRRWRHRPVRLGLQGLGPRGRPPLPAARPAGGGAAAAWWEARDPVTLSDPE